MECFCTPEGLALSFTLSSIWRLICSLDVMTMIITPAFTFTFRMFSARWEVWVLLRRGLCCQLQYSSSKTASRAKTWSHVHGRIISLMAYYRVFLVKWSFCVQSSFSAVKQLKVLGMIVSATSPGPGELGICACVPGETPAENIIIGTQRPTKGGSD